MINVPEGTKKLVFVMDGFEKGEVEVVSDGKNTVYLASKAD